MGQVEEIRKRLVKCPGLVNANKTLALAQLRYPYVTPEGVLNINTEGGGTKVTQVVVNLVKSMNQPQRTAYATAVLKGERPIVAANAVPRKS